MENDIDVGLTKLIFEHSLWPLTILIIILIFRKSIATFIESLKSIQIKDIKIALEQDIEPAMDELDDLTTRIEQLEKKEASTSHQPIANNEDEEYIKKRVLDALKNGVFRWRSVKKLAHISGTSSGQVLKILQKHPELVDLAVGKSGRKIAKMSNR